MGIFLANLLITSVICSLLILCIVLITPVLNRYTRKWRYIAFLLIALKLLLPLPAFTSKYALKIPIVGKNEVTGALQQNQNELQMINELQEKRQHVYYYGDYYWIRDVNEVLDKKDFGSQLIQRYEASENNNQYLAERPVAASATSNTDITEPDMKTQRNISITNVIFFVWLAGAIFAVSYNVLLYRYHRRNMRRWSRVVEDANIIRLLEEEKGRLGIGKEIKLFRCQKISTPMIVGVVNAAVLLPEMEYEVDELRYIFRHELIHYKHKDIYAKIFFIFIRCMYWFNPVMEMMLKNVHDDMEILCDDMVVKDLNKEQRIEYNQTLLNVAKYQLREMMKKDTIISLRFVSWKNELKERMANVMNVGKRKKGYSVLAVIIALLFLGNSMICYKEIIDINVSPDLQSAEQNAEHMNQEILKKQKTNIQNMKEKMTKTISERRKDASSWNFDKKSSEVNSYWQQCIFPVAAYVEQNYESFHVDEAQYYWKCVQMAVKACHISGYLMDKRITEGFAFDCFYSWENTVGYKVEAGIVDEIGRVFLGKTLQPKTITNQSFLAYDKEEDVYYILFDNEQEYWEESKIQHKNSDGTFQTSGSISYSKFNFNYRTQEYEIVVAENPESKLCGFSIVDIHLKNIY